MKSLIPLLLLVACETKEPTSEELELQRQDLEDRAAMREILNRLEVQTADLTVSAAGRGVLPGQATPMTNAEHLKEVYDLLLMLETRVLDLENDGIVRASLVTYDPRTTKLKARNVEDALDEIETRLQEVEIKMTDNSGMAGPGIFQISDGGPGGGGGDRGANDGPSDIPPGGGGGGGMGQGMSGGSGGNMGGQQGGGSDESSGGGGDQSSGGGGQMRGNTGQ
jgi:hypothetical protein